MFAASSPGSDQTPSSEYIHPMDRSPKAVASAGTSAVAPPKFHREDSVLSEGAALAFCIARSIISSVRLVRYRAFQDRKSVVEGTDVSVGVTLGGGSVHKNKK